MGLVQRGQHIGPKLHGSVVARVKRHPGYRRRTWSKQTNPVGKQRGLSKTRCGRNKDDALAEASIEEGQEARARNDLMGRGWKKELGQQQRIRKQGWDGLLFRHITLRLLVRLVHICFPLWR